LSVSLCAFFVRRRFILYRNIQKIHRRLGIIVVFFILPDICVLLSILFLSGVLIITSAVSASFWINAIYSWRRTLDLIVSKISFTIFVYNGVIYIRWIPYMIIDIRTQVFMFVFLFIWVLLYKFVLDKLPYDVSFVDDD
jgi:hypothetical protein